MGPWEIVMILVVVLLVFGAKRIPEIAQSLGKGITEFKRGVKDVQTEIENNVNTDLPPEQQPAQTTQTTQTTSGTETKS
ncbi:MAG: twin-arginine translocase TatA/TatE family subunit [Gemmatimonadetes bacterium]|nr:twin-arginine translocase TatA/TatE family subunit [Gemmatimonadota bacterium]MYB54790.1 twin-arginine translocase TatA/TatE family subunit [Gemmatimonadota bacterium]